MREYVFQPTGRLLAGGLERDLPGQLATCWSPASPLGHFVALRDRRILASRFEFRGPALYAREQLIEPGEDRVLGLAQGVAPGDELEEVRHALAINTCRGCHTTETGTKGLHLGQRTNGQKSWMSAFLSGASANGICNADLRDSDGDTQSSCAPQLVAPDGCPAEANPSVYHYNDLLRRHLYLDAVVNPPKGASLGSAAWYAAISRYATLQVH